MGSFIDVWEFSLSKTEVGQSANDVAKTLGQFLITREGNTSTDDGLIFTVNNSFLTSEEVTGAKLLNIVLFATSFSNGVMITLLGYI